MTRDLPQIDRAIAGHVRFRDALTMQRKRAACVTPADENVELVRADLDAAIARESAKIDALLSERAGITNRVDA